MSIPIYPSQINRNDGPLSSELNFNTKLIWQTFAFLVLFSIFMNKFFSEYYKFSQVRQTSYALLIAAKKVSILVIGYLICFMFIFLVLPKVVYPVKSITAQNGILKVPSNSVKTSLTPSVIDKDYYSFDIKFFSAFLSPFVVISSFAFAIFGGVGMAFLPLSLIQRWLDRPVSLTAEQHVFARKILLKESENAINVAVKVNELERDLKIIAKNDVKSILKNKRTLFKRQNQAKESLLRFEEMFDCYKRQDNILKSNPVYDLISLIVGIILIITSSSLVILAARSIVRDYFIMEWILDSGKKKFFFYGIFVLFLICLYFALAILAGSVKISRGFNGYLNSFPVKKNKTFTHSFFLHVNIMLFGLFGMMIYLVRSIPYFLRFIEFDFLVNKLIVRIKFIRYLYKWRVFEIIFIACFLYTLGKHFMDPSPARILMNKINERKVEFESDKEQILEIQKSHTRNF